MVDHSACGSMKNVASYVNQCYLQIPDNTSPEFLMHIAAQLLELSST